MVIQNELWLPKKKLLEDQLSDVGHTADKVWTYIKSKVDDQIEDMLDTGK